MSGSAMRREALEAPEAVARMLAQSGQALAALGARLRELGPPVVATSARGSSDHACFYLKYLIEIGLGIPVASVGPSVASVYGRRPLLGGAALISISQSGRSPDLVAFQAAARESGTLTVAMVNAPGSPLAAGADVVIPLCAGEEVSVAATKSFIASVAAAACLVAGWADDAAMGRAVAGLPETLRRACGCDWSDAVGAIAAAPSLYLLGRGPGFAIAQEAALKAKEVAAVHAEAFSLAEVMHGPLRLVRAGFPVMAFLPDDAAAAGNRLALARIVEVGGRVFGVGQGLEAVPTGHGLVDPIAMIQSYYLFIEAVCRARGLDPDRPENLRKVTETL
jgi:glucosamine--fructose-6-phosphate aminotransferase (isomerizing)